MFDPSVPIVLDAHNPGPMTGRGNNTYLLVGPGGGATLIDAGTGEAKHLDALSRQLSANNARLERVLVTHGHPDHASGAAVIKRAYPDALFLKFPLASDDTGSRVAWRPLADGDEIDVGSGALEVVHTPGHAPDHVVFWHRQSRSAFTGDLVVADSSVTIPWSQGGDLGRYLDSLDRLQTLSPRVLFPGHGPMIDHPAELIAAYLDHRRLRERQVVHALEQGRETVEAIAESIYDGLAPALAAAARENVRAHLEKLRSESRVSEQSGRWRTRG